MKTSLLKSTLLSATAVGALASAITPNIALAVETIGAVSAVNSEVSGTPPQTPRRSLSIGDTLATEELIESSDIGSGQFLFQDQTTLTIAPNSSLVLDKYVYDPATQKGEVSINMTRGVLRFVGGRITKDQDAVITTPTATIGIRGGMAVIIVDEDGTTRAMHVAGEYTRITRRTARAAPSGAAAPGGNNRSSQDSDDAEETVVISRSNGVARADGSGVTYVGVADRELVRATTISLTGRGQAGQETAPQDQDVTDSGLAQVNSGERGAAQRRPISTAGEAENDALEQGTEDEEVRGEEEVTTAILPTPPAPPPVGPTPPVVTPPPPVPPAPGLVLLTDVTGAAGFSIDTIDGLTIGTDGGAFVFTQVFEGSRVGETASGLRLSIPTEPGFFDFASGTGTSPRGDIGGSGFFDPVEDFTYAVFVAEDGSTGAFLAGVPSDPLGVTTQPGQRTARTYTLSNDLFTGGAAFLPGGLGAENPASGHTGLTLLSNDGGPAAGNNAAFVGGYLDIRNGGAETGFGVVTGFVDPAPTGTPSVFDFFEGSFVSNGQQQRIETPVVTLEDGQGNSAFGTDATYFALSNGREFGDAPEVGVQSAENGAETLFGSTTVATRTDVRTIASEPVDDATGGYVAVHGTDLGSGDRFAGRSLGHNGVVGGISSGTNQAFANFAINDFQSAETPTGGSVTSSFPQLFDLTVAFGGTDGRSATIDGDRFAMRQSSGGNNTANFADGSQDEDRQFGQGAFRGALASAAYVGDGGIFPAGVTAQSDHLVWGWWAGEFRHDSNQAGVSGSLDADQRFHLGTWIAGDVTTNIPTVGIASYEGFAVVSGYDNGVQFVDGAGYDMTYDFNGGLGTATFTDLLGSNASVNIDPASPGGNSHFGGSGTITIDGRAGNIIVDGSFFDADTVAAGAAGGSIFVQTNDQTLTGTGVFAGDRVSP